MQIFLLTQLLLSFPCLRRFSNQPLAILLRVLAARDIQICFLLSKDRGSGGHHGLRLGAGRAELFCIDRGIFDGSFQIVAFGRFTVYNVDLINVVIGSLVVNHVEEGGFVAVGGAALLGYLRGGVALGLQEGLVLLPHVALFLEVLDHLELRRVMILKVLLLQLFGFLVFLIPSPFIDLTLGKPTSVTHSDNCLLAPGWVLQVLLHKIVHLCRILPVPLLLVSGGRLLLPWALVVLVVLVFQAELTDLWRTIILHDMRSWIDFLPTQN